MQHPGVLKQDILINKWSDNMYIRDLSLVHCGEFKQSWVVAGHGFIKTVTPEKMELVVVFFMETLMH